MLRAELIIRSPYRLNFGAAELSPAFCNIRQSVIPPLIAFTGRIYFLLRTTFHRDCPASYMKKFGARIAFTLQRILRRSAATRVFMLSCIYIHSSVWPANVISRCRDHRFDDRIYFLPLMQLLRLFLACVADPYYILYPAFRSSHCWDPNRQRHEDLRRPRQ